MASLARANATSVRKKRPGPGLTISPVRMSPYASSVGSSFLEEDQGGGFLRMGVDYSLLLNNPELSRSSKIGENGSGSAASEKSESPFFVHPSKFPANYHPQYGELKREDFEEHGKIGEGAAGTVMKVRHKASNVFLAKKSIPVDPNPTIQRQIIRELAFLRTCNSPHIVSFYGAYPEEEDATIAICMEYCEGGSLDSIYKRVRERHGRIGEGVLGKVSESVLRGLVYLHQHRIIHRDVKPSNILVTLDGQIKLCDFGVSGELIDSVAKTFVGTSYYMAPERIQGSRYAVQSDVWSLGLTILEVAQNRFPFPPPEEPPLAIFELLDYIVRMPVPKLSPEEGWSAEFCNFIQSCLIKDPMERPTPKQILEHPFVVKIVDLSVDLGRWIHHVISL